MSSDFQNQNVYESFRTGMAGYHEWHERSSLVVQAGMVVGWAALMGVLAQVSIPLEPVPFTMQVFGVLLGAVLLGIRKGVAAQGLYVGAGFLGVPWFAGFSTGVMVIFTTGYLVGFVVAAGFVAAAVHALRIRSFFGLVGAMTIGLAVIYVLGWLWLAYAAPLPTGGHGIGPQAAFVTGVAPFVPADAAKILMAAGIAIPFLPGRVPRA